MWGRGFGPAAGLLPGLVAAICWSAFAASGPQFTEGIDALKRGDFPTAERRLKAELQLHPDEIEALSFLGVALDSQKKFAEADAAHRRALALAPRSNSILDKYASHLLATGDEPGARKTFLQSLSIDPADGYANLELAQLALKGKNGAEALTWLNRLTAEQQKANRMLRVRRPGGTRTQRAATQRPPRSPRLSATMRDGIRRLAVPSPMQANSVALRRCSKVRLRRNPRAFPCCLP